MEVKPNFGMQNAKLRWLAEELGLDVHQIVDISATWNTDGPVEIEYQGKMFMSQQDFRQLMDIMREEVSA